MTLLATTAERKSKVQAWIGLNRNHVASLVRLLSRVAGPERDGLG